eukprot:6535271-Alexandrium_andersonii.AAC.1
MAPAPLRRPYITAVPRPPGTPRKPTPATRPSPPTQSARAYASRLPRTAAAPSQVHAVVVAMLSRSLRDGCGGARQRRQGERARQHQ